jgi:hypothetical protein
VFKKRKKREEKAIVKNPFGIFWFHETNLPLLKKPSRVCFRSLTIDAPSKPLWGRQSRLLGVSGIKIDMQLRGSVREVSHEDFSKGRIICLPSPPWALVYVGYQGGGEGTVSYVISYAITDSTPMISFLYFVKYAAPHSPVGASEDSVV